MLGSQSVSQLFHGPAPRSPLGKSLTYDPFTYEDP